MRIIYCGGIRFPYFDAASAKVLNYSRAMREAGHEVSIISWGGTERKEDLCSDGKYRYDGFEYSVTNEIDTKGNKVDKILNRLKMGNKTLSILKRHLTEFDAVIFYNPNCKFTQTLLDFCKKNDKKLISDIDEWPSIQESYLIDIPYIWWNMTHLQHKVKNKILISSFLQNYYKNSHTIVMPSVCNIEDKKWQKRQLEWLPDILKSFTGKRLIYAGNPALKDMLHSAINVVNELNMSGKYIQFLIVGITKEDYIARYSSLLKDTNLHKNIVFLGRVAQDDVPAYYQLADFMVLVREPNRKSTAGFPTKFAEAMVSGTPVIANLTSDLGCYLKNGLTGFVVNDFSEGALKEVICNRLLTLNRVQIDEMKNKAYQTGLKYFDYRNYVKPLSDFLSKLY